MLIFSTPFQGVEKELIAIFDYGKAMTRMKQAKYYIAAGLFLALTAVKFLVPGAAETVRGKAAELLDRDTDYTAVIHYIRSELLPGTSPEGDEHSGAQPMPAEKTPASLPAGTGKMRRETLPEAEQPAGKDLTGQAAATSAPAGAEEPEQALEQAEPQQEQSAAEDVPAAVQAFLDSQAAFSEYGTPENVSYALQELPFSYRIPVGGYSASGFGYRLHPILDEVKFHYGTDVAANSGDDIGAFAAGTVTFAGEEENLGNYVTVDHGGGWQSLYAHCGTVYVKAGDSVQQGQKLALVGATGLATGPHLHFELTHDGVYLNPEYYINH